MYDPGARLAVAPLFCQVAPLSTDHWAPGIVSPDGLVWMVTVRVPLVDPGSVSNGLGDELHQIGYLAVSNSKKTAPPDVPVDVSPQEVPQLFFTRKH